MNLNLFKRVLRRKRNRALLNAAENANLQKMRAALKKGADINAQNKKGQTALMKVIDPKPSLITKTNTPGDVLNNILNIATLLLKNGADVNKEDNEGRTALMHLALNVGDFNKAVEKYEWHLWRTEDCLSAAEWLYKTRVDIYINFMRWLLKIIKLLIESEADVNIKDNEDQTFSTCIEYATYYILDPDRVITIWEARRMAILKQRKIATRYSNNDNNYCYKEIDNFFEEDYKRANEERARLRNYWIKWLQDIESLLKNAGAKD